MVIFLEDNVNSLKIWVWDINDLFNLIDSKLDGVVLLNLVLT